GRPGTTTSAWGGPRPCPSDTGRRTLRRAWPGQGWAGTLEERHLRQVGTACQPELPSGGVPIDLARGKRYGGGPDRPQEEPEGHCHADQDIPPSLADRRPVAHHAGREKGGRVAAAARAPAPSAASEGTVHGT